MSLSASQKTPWTPEEDATLRAGLADGLSPCSIATRIGRSQSSVYRRIEVLEERNRKTERPCMCCGHEFMSDGPHNRLCGVCRRKS